MKDLPYFIPILFIATSAVAVYFFYRAAGRKIVLPVLACWILFHSLPSVSGFFTTTNTTPPRFLLLVLPPFLLLILLFRTRAGRRFMDGFDVRWLAFLHVLRIPVEATLYALSEHGMVPALMTFEGRNFDIISGITAPLVFYFGYVKHKLSNSFLLGWNFLALAILAFTVANGILSAPSPFQQLAFDQPNRALLYFPYTWLPGLVVPIVYTAHLITIRNLLLLRQYRKRAPGTLETQNEILPVNQSTRQLVN